ncbi:MAG: Uncharacterised protein [Arcobacter lacus]|nr:MAG: Uncharacterised protein [Arcobacter lacus]
MIRILPLASLAFTSFALACVPDAKAKAELSPANFNASLLDIPTFFTSSSISSNALSNSFFDISCP